MVKGIFLKQRKKIFSEEEIEKNTPSQILLGNLSCQEVISRLPIYWQRPEEISDSKRAKISYHLLNCRACQKEFLKLKEKITV